MAVVVAETAAVVVAATMVAAAADADLTANKRRRSITLRRFFLFIFFFQTLFKAFHNSFQCFYAGIFFIVALKYRPWCYICGGKCYHAVNIFLIGVPLFTVAPILIGYLLTLFRRVLTLVKTAELFVFIYIHPEFYYLCAPSMKLAFKLVYLTISHVHTFFGGELFDRLDHYSSIPCAVKDSKVTILFKTCPETP